MASTAGWCCLPMLVPSGGGSVCLEAFLNWEEYISGPLPKSIPTLNSTYAESPNLC